MSEIGVGETPRIRISNTRGSERTVRVPKFVRNIPPITEINKVRTREDLAKVVESPLLPAAQVLYDLNIETTSSSANYQDVEGREHAARLIINFDSLSSENQRIALELLGEPHRDRPDSLGNPGSRLVRIMVPLTRNSTEQEVARKALELARRFKKQRMTWAPTFTPEEVVGHESEYYYDEGSNTYYLCKEHYLKANGFSLKVEPK